MLELPSDDDAGVAIDLPDTDGGHRRAKDGPSCEKAGKTQTPPVHLRTTSDHNFYQIKSQP
jgi:hypothetical protein